MLVPPTQEYRVHEHVPLGAVVNGQGIDVDVAGFVLAIDDAAHILGDEGLVVDDDPLRFGFGAAGDLQGLDAQETSGSVAGAWPYQALKSVNAGCPAP